MLLQVTEAAQHAPTIVREAGQVQTPTGVFALIAVVLGLGFAVLGVALYFGLRKGGEKAGEAAGSSAASTAVGEITKIFNDALPKEPVERKKALREWATLPQTVSGLGGQIDAVGSEVKKLAKKVDEQGSAMPAAVAEEIARRTVRWRGDTASVDEPAPKPLRAAKG